MNMNEENKFLYFYNTIVVDTSITKVDHIFVKAF